MVDESLFGGFTATILAPARTRRLRFCARGLHKPGKLPLSFLTRAGGTAVQELYRLVQLGGQVCCMQQVLMQYCPG